jgi:hypothetical protein
MVPKLLIKKELLLTVINTGMYCSRKKVVEFTHYNPVSKIPPST